MMWNPFDKLRKKFGGAATPEFKPQPVPKELVGAIQGDGLPDMKELEKKGLLGRFFRHWKDPAFLKQIRAVAARMQAEGINVKDPKAVKLWMEKHQKELESGQISPATAEAPKTFVKTGPEIGRNAPCSCGSGKKYKKCCGR